MIDAHDWFRTRPQCIQHLIFRFPPVCRVRATRPLVCPAPGRVGRVVSYYEDGTVRVMDEEAWLTDDVSGVDGECDPDWLEVVQYDGNKSPEWVARVLAGEDLPADNPGQENRIAGLRPGEPLSAWTPDRVAP